MHEHKHRCVIGFPNADAEKIADADIDRHPHALHGTAQDDPFAMKFDVADAAVSAHIMRFEADR